MNIKELRETVEQEACTRGLFIVDMEASPDNDITVTIEKESGHVDMDDCAGLSEFITGRYSRDEEDYSLTVTSAGLDQPFKVLRQYLKAIGTKVDIKLKGGRRLIAELAGADEDGVQVRYTALEAVEGKKKKMPVEHDERIEMSQINSVTPWIEFE